jgi:hypothetical protein
MELVDACSSEPNVEDASTNDVKQGHYCPGLVDHLELKPFDVLTSSRLKNKMPLVVASAIEVVHDVGSFLFYPFMELGILQESATTSNFANYSYQKITNTFGFANEALHLELVLHKIPKILSLVIVSCQYNATTLGFPKGDLQEMTTTFGFLTHIMQEKHPSLEVSDSFDF